MSSRRRAHHELELPARATAIPAKSEERRACGRSGLVPPYNALSDLQFGFHALAADRAQKLLVVARGLGRIGEGEFRHRPVELVRPAAVSGQSDRVARAGMPLGQY